MWSGLGWEVGGETLVPFSINMVLVSNNNNNDNNKLNTKKKQKTLLFISKAGSVAHPSAEILEPRTGDVRLLVAITTPLFK